MSKSGESPARPGAAGVMSAGETPRYRRGRIAGAIYGQILVTSTVAAYSEDDSLDAWLILVAVASTMLVFWLAHVYAQSMERRAAVERPLRLTEIRELCIADWPLLQSAVPPLIALGLGAIGLLSTAHAVTLALIVGVVDLFIWALAIGYRWHVSWPRTMVGAAMSAGLGLVVVLLKISLH